VRSTVEGDLKVCFRRREAKVRISAQVKITPSIASNCVSKRRVDTTLRRLRLDTAISTPFQKKSLTPTEPAATREERASTGSAVFVRRADRFEQQQHIAFRVSEGDEMAHSGH